ncbi:hypothetical protein Anapl_16543 [Anas platyrhynchos]|uniref:Uncharacterized protein n=1 Tax=Anas platyrhynchos TaxID=8839 RepID=R0LC29_ANAPL|nr:hypothetical protein Anapl_16543 [Anas platyrhynchos]
MRWELQSLGGHRARLESFHGTGQMGGKQQEERKWLCEGERCELAARKGKITQMMLGMHPEFRPCDGSDGAASSQGNGDDSNGDGSAAPLLFLTPNEGWRGSTRRCEPCTAQEGWDGRPLDNLLDTRLNSQERPRGYFVRADDACLYRSLRRGSGRLFRAALDRRERFCTSCVYSHTPSPSAGSARQLLVLKEQDLAARPEAEVDFQHLISEASLKYRKVALLIISVMIVNKLQYFVDPFPFALQTKGPDGPPRQRASPPQKGHTQPFYCTELQKYEGSQCQRGGSAPSRRLLIAQQPLPPAFLKPAFINTENIPINVNPCIISGPQRCQPLVQTRQRSALRELGQFCCCRKQNLTPNEAGTLLHNHLQGGLLTDPDSTARTRPQSPVSAFLSTPRGWGQAEILNGRDKNHCHPGSSAPPLPPVPHKMAEERGTAAAAQGERLQLQPRSLWEGRQGWQQQSCEDAPGTGTQQHPKSLVPIKVTSLLAPSCPQNTVAQPSLRPQEDEDGLGRIKGTGHGGTVPRDTALLPTVTTASQILSPTWLRAKRLPGDLVALCHPAGRDDKATGLLQGGPPRTPIPGRVTVVPVPVGAVCGHSLCPQPSSVEAWGRS